MTNFRIQKLDRRHNGYGRFAYYIEPQIVNPTWLPIGQWPGKKQLFIEIRQWFWETFGPSREIQFINPDDKDLGWVWDSEHGHLRIYTQEKMLEWFLLKWNK